MISGVINIDSPYHVLCHKHASLAALAIKVKIKDFPLEAAPYQANMLY
jgi:hypothetical protein